MILHLYSYLVSSSHENTAKHKGGKIRETLLQIAHTLSKIQSSLFSVMLKGEYIFYKNKQIIPVKICKFFG